MYISLDPSEYNLIIIIYLRVNYIDFIIKIIITVCS